MELHLNHKCSSSIHQTPPGNAGKYYKSLTKQIHPPCLYYKIPLGFVSLKHKCFWKMKYLNCIN